MGKPRDDKDAAQDLSRDLADIAGQLGKIVAFEGSPATLPL
jgi:hypothetical protein